MGPSLNVPRLSSQSKLSSASAYSTALLDACPIQSSMVTQGLFPYLGLILDMVALDSLE